MLRIKEVLAKRGNSQTWLSKELGISKNATNGLVNESTKPSLTRLFEIAKILQCSICDLIEPNEYKSILNEENEHPSIFLIGESEEPKQNNTLDQSELINYIQSLEAQIKGLQELIKEINTNTQQSNLEAIKGILNDSQEKDGKSLDKIYDVMIKLDFKMDDIEDKLKEIKPNPNDDLNELREEKKKEDSESVINTLKNLTVAINRKLGTQLRLKDVKPAQLDAIAAYNKDTFINSLFYLMSTKKIKTNDNWTIIIKKTIANIESSK